MHAKTDISEVHFSVVDVAVVVNIVAIVVDIVVGFVVTYYG